MSFKVGDNVGAAHPGYYIKNGQITDIYSEDKDYPYEIVDLDTGYVDIFAEIEMWEL